MENIVQIPYIHLYSVTFILYLIFTIINLQAIFWLKKPMDLGKLTEHHTWFINDFKKLLYVNTGIFIMMIVLTVLMLILSPWHLMHVILMLITAVLSFAFFYMGAVYLKNMLNRHFETTGDASLIRQYYHHRYPIYLALLLTGIFSLAFFAVSLLVTQMMQLI